MTSKVGTKAAALNSEPEQYLESFGEMNEPSLESFEKAEKYLARVLLKNSKCTNFIELRYEFLQQNLYMKLEHYNRRSSFFFFFLIHCLNSITRSYKTNLHRASIKTLHIKLTEYHIIGLCREPIFQS